ncbi:hypothetical protein V8D89_000098 [Ganoderma adspersum]
MTDAPATAHPKTKQSGQGDDSKTGTEQGQASTLQRQSGEQAQGKKAQQQQQQQQPDLLQPICQFDAAVAQACIDLVEAYWHGGKPHGEIVLQLAKKLQLRGTAEDDTAASTAFNAYCAQLSEIDVTRKERESRTGSQEREELRGHANGEGDRRRSCTLCQSKGKKRADCSRSHLQSRSSGARSNSRSISPFDLSDGEPRSSKRQKPDLTKFTWAENSRVAEKKLRPEVLDMLTMLRRYAVDIRFAKSNLINSLRRAHPSEDLILWKSDVSQAYRRMPMSPHWQIFQVITIDGQHHIDRCNTFGGHASLHIWLAFYCLVAWIAVHKCGLSMLVNYVDDSAGIQLHKFVQWYLRYEIYMPRDQAHLLGLWDELGLGHDRPKQLFAPRIAWIGFEVDADSSHATLPSDAKQKLLTALEDFCGPSRGRRRTLAEFQSLAGYVNWALNVFPLLRPALSNLYHKIADKRERFATIYVNKAIRTELTWMSDHVRALPGIRILSTNAWSPADLTPNSLDDEFAMVDASSLGLGLYFPWHHLGFYCPTPSNIPTNGIFFPEALAICSAIHKLPAWRSVGRHIKRIAILSDSTNAVHIFQSLCAEPTYNPILMSAIDVLINNGTEHRVDHILGQHNVTADALSHDAAIDLNTSSSYGTARNMYLSFCQRQQLPFEPTSDTLSLFIVHEVLRNLEPRSVDSYLSGVCNQLEPFYPRVRLARRLPLVCRTLKGATLRLYSKPSKRKRALATDDLELVLTALKESSLHDDKLFLAQLLTGFHGLLRLGEMVWPDNPKLRTSRKLSLRTSTQINPSSFSFLLHSHKSDKFFDGDRVLIDRQLSGTEP